MTEEELTLFRAVKHIPGAISMTEALALYHTIREELRSTSETFLDLGSHMGKSSVVGCAALASTGRRGHFYMVDPLYDQGNRQMWERTTQKSPDNIPWGHATRPGWWEDFVARTRDLCDLPTSFIGMLSVDALKLWNHGFGYVFLDSDDHQEELVREEVELLEDLIIPGGLLFFHDFGNQYTGPMQGWQYLIDTGKFEAIPINWDRFVALSREWDLENGNDSWHMPGVDYPTYLGCVRRL